MSFLNALATDGLSVGLRISNARLNDSAALRQREVTALPDQSPVRPVAAKESAPRTAAKNREQSAEERASGRAEACAALEAEGCLGRIQAAEQEPEEQDAEKKDGEKEEGASPAGAQDLTEEEKKQVEELKRRDREVKAHEQAHMAAAAGLAGAPSYEYQSGPDGKRYAVGGEVGLRTSGSSDPEKALREAEIVKRAATAPADPSSTDRAVAAKASADINRLKAESVEQRQNGGEDENDSPQSPPESSEEAPQPSRNGEAPVKKAVGVYKTMKLGFEQITARSLLARA